MNKILFLSCLTILVLIGCDESNQHLLPENRKFKKVVFYNQELFMNKNEILKNISVFNLNSSAQCSDDKVLCYFSILDSLALKKLNVFHFFKSLPNVKFIFLKADSTLVSVSTNFYLDTCRLSSLNDFFYSIDSVNYKIKKRKSDLFGDNIVNCDLTFNLQ